MQLQYLNGISHSQSSSILDSVHHQLLHSRADVDSVICGFDLDNYQGLNTASDTEKIRSYILRTKRIADESPALIQSTRNPETFSQMCAYILQYWDTAERERAALLMAQREKQLFAHGMIRRMDGDDFGSEFFKAIYMMLCPQTKIAGLCGTTILKRAKQKLRKSIALARKKRINPSSSIIRTINLHRRTAQAQTPNLSGINDPMDELTISGLIYGLDDQCTGADGTNYRYITRLHNAIDEAPTLFFPTENEARAVVSGLGGVLKYWDNDQLRDAVCTQAANNPVLSQDSRALFGLFKKIGKAVKKAAKAVAKGVKKAAKAVAKITKKIGKKIAKVAKKVVKFLIRFNPVTAIMRAILCLCARCNWFSLASKCYPGSLSEADALKLGISKDDYKKKYLPSYKKFWSVFDKIGGKESKLKSRLKTGYSRKPKGDLNTSVSKSSISKYFEEGDKEAKEEITDEQLQLKKEGAVEDSKVPEGVIQKTQVTVEVAENAVTTTAAASLYETASTAKVLTNIPANTPLLYDTSVNNTTYYNVNYAGQNGYIKKSLCRKATDDEASKLSTTDTTKTVTVDAPVSGLGYIEPLTLTAIAGSVSTITGLVSAVAKAFGKDKVANVADAVSTSANATNAITSGGQNIVAELKSSNNIVDKVKNVVSTVKSTSQAVKAQPSTATTTTATTTAASTSTSQPSKVQSVTNTINDIASKAQSIIKPLTQATPIQSQSSDQSSSDQSQNTTANTSFSISPTDATKKYLLIGGIALAGGLAVFALSRRK